MGNVIYTNIGIANNVPFAAAMALFPVAIMAVYLLGARALGAFRADQWNPGACAYRCGSRWRSCCCSCSRPSC